ncbi:MAG TPA: PHP domain-containing protein [Gemmatimonadales bacterium]|nr:PHP domain-containing protein [Gemmatimonadales bacterium]
MDRQSVRQVFEQIAASLAIKGDNPFRIRAFENAARAVADFPGDFDEAVRSGALLEAEGIGKGTLQIVRELTHSGRSELLDELREQVPPGLVEMLRIPGLGVTKVRQIHEALHVDSLAELEEVAADGRLAALPRFGAKTADRVRRGIASLRRASEFMLIHHALTDAEGLRRALASEPGVERVELAGSVRRRSELVRDIDLVVQYAPQARDPLVRRLGEIPGVAEFVGKEGGVTLRFASGLVADVFLAPAAAFGLTWVRATGSAEHVRQLEARGLGSCAPAADEAAVYQALGLTWIPPELREGMGEIEAAAQGRLPKLVKQPDLLGFLHCHTNYSDGSTTIAEWAAACRTAGYQWVGITDHSGSASYAGGLKAGDVPRQHAEIDAVNAATPGFRVLKGVEADILADGSLDYGPEVLDRFDFVIGSIHSRFAMTGDEMTARVLSAMEDPRLTILGHPTGRLLNAREPYAIDIDRILTEAARRRVAIEVNADPHRLDLDWRHVRTAQERGVTISIGADAHAVSGMAHVPLGLGVARKGWLSSTDVLNARDAVGFLAFARARRAS